MSQSQSEDCQVPQIVENQFATELHIYESGDECPSPASATPEPEASTPKEQAEDVDDDKVDRLAVPQQVVLSTTSPAALKVGKEQMIPKKLAVSSRPKNRHHTTVVTFPVGLENSSSANQSRRSDVSWDDYDSDGEGFGIRRNRRNQSYRAAIISLNFETLATEQATATELKPVREGRAPSPAPIRTHGRKVHKLRPGGLRIVLYSAHLPQIYCKLDENLYACHSLILAYELLRKTGIQASPSN